LKWSKVNIKDQVRVEYAGLRGLFEVLRAHGYRLVGPQLREGAIIYDELVSVDDLPAGWSDEQEGGKYRLRKRDDDALFGYAVGPHSWKKFLFPAVIKQWHARRTDSGLQFSTEPETTPKYAFIGVRSCELHAIAVQDKVFMGEKFVDPVYAGRRKNAFIVALNCGQAGGTCFCVSMKTGPKAQAGFDLALTEIIEEGHHYFIVEVGTEAGARFLTQIPHRRAAEQEQKAAEQVVQRTAERMGRVMDTADIKELLYRNYEHPRWDDVASRCLTCANCTMVCPTCFCSTVEDVTDLTGEHAERWRKWDSCFHVDFSYVAGGSVRPSTKSRYRQWMTHKLATWIDQFGTSGCVGCGRCVTWCPVAIDITEEVRAIRETESRRLPTSQPGGPSRGHT
jgi:formate hydrogenlyase subunit 6/NADH:ubiquinone oxidoreductase subunit I